LPALQDELLLEQRGAVAAVRHADDRHQRFTGHITAEDEHIGLVEGASVEEFFPADIGTMNVRGEEQTGQTGPPYVYLHSIKKPATSANWASASHSEAARGQCRSVAYRL